MLPFEVLLVRQRRTFCFFAGDLASHGLYPARIIASGIVSVGCFLTFLTAFSTSQWAAAPFPMNHWGDDL